MTRHTTEKDRFRIRVLYFDARQTKREIMQTTGFTLHQVRKAIESGAVKKRSGRPSQKKAKVTSTPALRAETAETESAPEAAHGSMESQSAQSESAQGSVEPEGAQSQSAEPVTTRTAAAEPETADPEALPESAPESAPVTTETETAEQLLQVVANAL